MGILKTVAREFILPLSIVVGADKFFLNKSKKSRCIINFHGVRKTNLNVFNNRHIPDSEFEKIIRYLSRNYNIVPLSEIFEMHRQNKPVSRKTIALTFDDGYKNNFEIALPILKKYHVPATFYLISKGLTDQGFLVWPDLIDIIKKLVKEDVQINSYIFKYPSFYNEELKMELLSYLKTCGSKTELLVADLASKYPEVKKFVNSNVELVELINGGDFKKHSHEPLIEYGSHTHTHFNLEYLQSDMIQKELKESKDIIENIIGKKVISIAYPDGSYTPETNKIALEEGYTNLVAVEYKFSENNSNPNLLSRFTISNSTTFESNVLRLAKTFDKYGF